MIPAIADALETEGITDAFPIQAMALPLALEGHDVIGQARTGTGKTLAFGVSMLQHIGQPRKNRKKPRGLVIVPTRELAIQVTDDLRIAGGKLGTRVLSVYGGRAYEPQIDALKDGVDIVVGTPGRLLDLAQQRKLDLSQVKTLVLDEADRMLDLGFLPDVERILSRVPDDRQTMLFSATMPGEVVTLSRQYLSQPTRVRAEHDPADESPGEIIQYVWRTHRMDKIELLARILQAKGRGLSMVFCQTKRACDMVQSELSRRGFAAAAVHGDLGQGQREQALRAFRAGKIDVLVATDVAARGIDIDDVTHVINYDCPDDDKDHTHRIGRTGRAGRTGVAVTFVEWEQLTRWKVINNALELGVPDPPETYSSSEHVYSLLDIPAEAKGRLPRASRNRAGLAAEEIEDIGETGRTRSRDRGEERRRPRSERPKQRQRRRTRAGRAVNGSGADTPVDGVSQPEDARTGRSRSNTKIKTAAGGTPPSTNKAPAGDTSPSNRAQASDTSPSSKAQASDAPPSSKALAGDTPASNRAQAGDTSPSSKAQASDTSPSSKAQASDTPTSSKAQASDTPTSSKAQASGTPPSNGAPAGDAPPSSKAPASDTPTSNGTANAPADSAPASSGVLGAPVDHARAVDNGGPAASVGLRTGRRTDTAPERPRRNGRRATSGMTADTAPEAANLLTPERIMHVPDHAGSTMQDDRAPEPVSPAPLKPSSAMDIMFVAPPPSPEAEEEASLPEPARPRPTRRKRR